MLSDYKELLSILNAHRVKYLVVGAYAVAIHAQPRATKNLDILVKAARENAKAVFAARAEFGAPLESLTSADFAEPGPFFRWAASRPASTSSRQFQALSLKPHGRAGLRTCLQRNAPLADGRTSPTSRHFEKAATSQQPKPSQRKPPEPTPSGPE